MVLTRAQEAAAAEMEAAGKSYKEIGRELGCSDKAAKAAAVRGKALAPAELQAEQALSRLFSRYHRRLNEREAQLMAMRLGKRGHRRHTLAEIGEVLGLSRQRVAQLEQRAVEKLQR